MCSWPVVLKCAVLAALTGLRNAPELFERPWRGPVFGYCDEKYLYASIDGADFSTSGRIFRQPLVLAKLDERQSTERFTIEPYCDRERIYRWRIADKVYFGSSDGIGPFSAATRRIPLTDLDLLDDANPAADKQRAERRLKRYPFDRDLSEAHTWNLSPLADLYEKLCSTRPHQFTRVVGLDGSVAFNMIQEPKMPDVFRDELPVGRDKIKVFVLRGRRITVWAGSFAGPKPPADPVGVSSWESTWSKKPVETIRSAFNSGFLVVARGDDYYFITDHGSIYVSPKPAKGERTMYPAWTKERDPDRNPITHVITDLTTGRMFAFDMNESVTFFEVAPIPDLDVERPEMVHHSKSPYPLKQVRDCVDTLIKYGKIKPGAAGAKKKE